MAETSNSRLRQARIAAKFRSATAAAKRYGWTVSTYLSHENGQTPVPSEAAEIYASKFKTCSASWIVYGDSAGKGPPKSKLVEIAETLPPHLHEEASNYLEYLKRARGR
jgi:hypothetical protein